MSVRNNIHQLASESLVKLSLLLMTNVNVVVETNTGVEQTGKAILRAELLILDETSTAIP